MSAYLTIARDASAEIEVRRSRFLCTFARVQDEEAARAVVDGLRRRHHDARHHCSAFVLGPERSLERSSDDGEPAGTAGAPMLEVLRGHQLALDVGHADAGRVESELRRRGVRVLDTAYDVGVRLRLAVPPADVRRLHELVAELTSGGTSAEPAGERWVDA